MSGICGIVHLDGAPADRKALSAMARAMAFRGPDRQESRLVDGGGFARSLLRTGTEPDEVQPLTFDGNTWIVADARIDAREELRASLAARGRPANGCGDAALILHAWHAWDEDCASRLLGDFAFAIWDAQARRLFCARDPFGVKALFVARVGDSVAFGNTMDSLRAHRAVPSAFDESCIADFLLFEHGLDPEATGFAAIRRIRPGHVARFSRSHAFTREYWALPDRIEPVARPGGQAEGLREVLEKAVADRLRTTRVVVQMSGGLDSTAVAALARRALANERSPFDLRAHTIVYDRLVPDEERRFARLAAEAIGIPHECHAGDRHALYERFGDYQARFPAPHHGPDVIVGFDCLRAAAGHARVLLTGYDGDAILEEPRRRWRTWLRRALGRDGGRPGVPDFPAWIAPGLAARLRLRERWDDHHARLPAPAHPARPSAHRFLSLMRATPSLFDQYEPGTTGLPLECRHPFLDLRVVEYCLGLPPEPWCVGKKALREAMRGLLPEPVRTRPKTPMLGWPGGVLLGREDAAALDRFVPSAHLGDYVDRRRVPAVCGSRRPLEDWMHLRPLTLDLWMRRQVAGFTSKELLDETA